MENSFLFSLVIFIAAAVIAVPLAKKLQLGSVLGYLLAGIVIGPWVLGLITDVDTILHFSELGVVLMMFIIGLELEIRKLWALRRSIFGYGGVQMLACVLCLQLTIWLCGWPWQVACVAALGLALSSTAVALAILKERNLLNTGAGMAGFGILLFQDIAAIPILTILPLFVFANPELSLVASASAAEVSASSAEKWWLVLRGLATIALIIGVGRWLLRPMLRLIANTGYRELFTGFALLLVAGVALLMQEIGLSMALGALIAGVLLADSEYRHALETDIEPFKGLLLGLFFIAVGMTIDFSVLLKDPALVILAVLGMVLLKSLILFGCSRWFGISQPERALFAIVLSQGSEFAFVVFATATQLQIFTGQQAAYLNLVVALSMASTPLLLILHDRFWLPRMQTPAANSAEPVAYQQHPVIIAGFGRYGQIIGRMLLAQGIRPTVLEVDPEQIESLRKFGYKVFYGDATRMDLLHAAGAGEAKILVVAIDDIDDSLHLIKLVREHFPHLQIVARARNVSHVYRLMDLGVTHIERETFESALRSARSTLTCLGVAPSDARRAALKFRRHNLESLQKIYPHYQDQKALVSMAKQARAELEEMFRADQNEQTEKSKTGWH
ncbi:glutathione-regulated potassium-efflux system protein KefC [Parvibium lacunae]|uniref:Glutathione-regulated potassium-efflux system protein KefC n=1 Tax=Parvibium lacunae TaxID=1888893 RepID=A0A368KZF0_9BURK|nr:glutathione-regulated potassium-efflux system protein KefC [Parvibium lacunae]RCS56484.1 glutathione-regulated potassium-efflux system protein KefC [Parvibium lacunae]